MLGGSGDRIAAGEPQSVDPPHGSDVYALQVFARIHGYVQSPRRSSGCRVPTRSACSGSRSTPAGARRQAQELERLRGTHRLRDLWQELGDIEDDDGTRGASRLTFKLLHVADILTVTGRPRDRVPAERRVQAPIRADQADRRDGPPSSSSRSSRARSASAPGSLAAATAATGCPKVPKPSP